MSHFPTDPYEFLWDALFEPKEEKRYLLRRGTS